MYPGYNFIQNPLFQNRMGQSPMPPIGQLPQMGQPTLGQVALQSDHQQPNQSHSPFSQFNPMFGMMGMLGHSAPYAALGGLLGFGLHKLKVF